MLRDGDEIALLDVREEGVFSETGTRCSPSRCRCRGSNCCSAIWCRAGDAHRAAGRRRRGPGQARRREAGAMGYTNVAVMEGGRKAWAAPGSRSSPASTCRARRSASWSSTLRHAAYRCRRAEEPARCRRGNPDPRLPADPEFRNMSIPGAFDCPGAELVYRVQDLLRRRTPWSSSTAPAARAASSARSR